MCKRVDDEDRVVVEIGRRVVKHWTAWIVHDDIIANIKREEGSIMSYCYASTIACIDINKTTVYSSLSKRRPMFELLQMDGAAGKFSSSFP